MPVRGSYKNFVKMYAERLGCSEEDAAKLTEAFVDTLLQEFKNRNRVTINHLGGFYIEDRHDSTVFKFNPAQKLKAILGWSNTYKGDL